MVDLFGGAIVAPIPSSFMDASQFRQIPDNQEVFVDTKTQQSMIVELLEQVDQKDEKIAHFHFQQLADDNEANEAHIIQTENLSLPLIPDSQVYLLQGEQKVAKFNETNAFNTVEIILAVVRLVKVETDLVISLNAPAQLANGSSEQTSVSETEKVTIDMVKNEMKTLLDGLQVKDWRLFG